MNFMTCIHFGRFGLPYMMSEHFLSGMFQNPFCMNWDWDMTGSSGSTGSPQSHTRLLSVLILFRIIWSAFKGADVCGGVCGGVISPGGVAMATHRDTCLRLRLTEANVGFSRSGSEDGSESDRDTEDNRLHCYCSFLFFFSVSQTQSGRGFLLE